MNILGSYLVPSVIDAQMPTYYSYNKSKSKEIGPDIIGPSFQLTIPYIFPFRKHFVMVAPEEDREIAKKMHHFYSRSDPSNCTVSTNETDNFLA
jgi:hypothetical protein